MITKDEACKKAFKDYRVEELHEASNKARQAAFEAHNAYLAARDEYHKFYRKIWND